ncbi:cellulase family glycosylhydrolase [Aquabacterium sp.]|uniref:cellulase family glycosylhydrolase n=1 Tax=Aquabacterium sp. TaxID=1872578 RepID=UPI003D6D93E9
MKTKQKILPLVGASLALMVPLAHAGLTLSQFVRFNPLANPQTSAHTPIPVGSGDRIQALSFDSSVAGQYAAASLTLAQPIAGQYIRFKLRAPFGNQASILVTDSSNATQEYLIERGPLPVDDLGWSAHTQALNKPFSGSVKAVTLRIYSDASKPKGTAYIRGIQLLPTAPLATDPVVSTPTVEVTTAQFMSQLGNAGGQVTTASAVNGDDVHPLPFNFTNTDYVSLDMVPQSPAPGSYLRFKMRVPPGVRVGLRVVDQSNETHQYDVDRSLAVADKQGWTTHTVRLGETTPVWGGDGNKQITGAVQKISLLVTKTTGATNSDTAYFKEIDFLDHAPSALEPLVPMPLLATGNPAVLTGGDANLIPGATVEQSAPLPNGDRTRSLVFNMGGSGTYQGMIMNLQSVAPGGKVFRFLGRIPKGMTAVVRAYDTAGPTYDTRLVAPLNTTTDGDWEGQWVQYAVNLGVQGGNIDRVAFIVSSAGKSGMVNLLPTGKASFKSFALDGDGQRLDLGPATAALTGMRPRNTDPLPTTGVASRLVLEDIQRAYDMGFKRIRFDLSWNKVEKIATTPPTFTFSDYEAGLADLFSKQMGAVAILAYNNNNYAAVVNNTDHAGISTAALREKYVRYAAATAQYIKNTFPGDVGKVVFEIWNEPNSNGFWQPVANAADYAETVKQATAAIKNVSPAFRVMSGGTYQLAGTVQNDTAFIESVRSLQGFTGLDGIGIHPYDNGYPERQASEYMGYTNFLSTNGVKTPLWSSEVGSSSAPTDTSNGADTANRRLQAQMFVRSILTSWSLGAPMHISFSLKDSSAFGGATEQNYGLFEAGGTPKPAKQAVELLFKAAKARSYEGLVTGSPSAVQAMKFSAPSKEVVYVVWANSGGATTYPVSALKSCSASLGFDGLPATNVPCAVDLLGQPLTCTDGAVNSRMVCNVSEINGPVFIRMAQ